MFKTRKISVVFIFAVIASAWCISSAEALPGFTPYINDVSGEYVYYQDTTFDRTSYIGFLYYNDSTYAVRYYAPEDKDKQLPEKSMEILFLLDSSADHIELTGERIVNNITPDDAEFVNYIHDIFYELNARRIKAGRTFPSGFSGKQHDVFSCSDIAVADTFPQFGGEVTMKYNYLVPLFNLKSIVSDENTVLLQIVTMGTLRTSADTSFTDFTGIPEKYFDGSHTFVYNKKAERKVFTTSDGQTVPLDSQWTQSMDNLWLLGDSAIVSAAVIPPLGSVETDKGVVVVLRRMLQSTQGSYISWRDISLTYAENRYIINGIFYQPESNTVTRTFRILSEKNGGGYYFFTLSVFNNIYQAGHSYFDTIIGGYAVPKQGALHE
jgi:hypothetical protein